MKETEWNNDEELFALVCAELYTAVIGDICDNFGLRTQFLSPDIRPLSGSQNVPVMVGRAMPVLEVNVFDVDENCPFGKMLDALDDLKPGEVYVCAGASPTYATIGEIMATAMQKRGARGAVTDSRVRDTSGILELDFPLFSIGSYGQDQRGRGIVSDYRVPIMINGVRIECGDLIVGDVDGVLVVPKEHVGHIVTLALEKSRGEKTVKKAILDGMSAGEAFRRYGIM